MDETCQELIKYELQFLNGYMKDQDSQNKIENINEDI